MHPLVKQLLPLIPLIIGATAQGATLPYWIHSFPKNVGGPYFIICWASLLFTIFYGFSYMFILCKGYRTVKIKNYIINYFFQGLSNALNGVFVVYASDPDHTPPVIFQVIANLGIIFTIIFTRLLVKEKKNINYCHYFPIISLILLFVSCSLSIIADFVLQVKGAGYDGNAVLWMIVALVGTAFGSLYSVLQERYLKVSKKEYNITDSKDEHVNEMVTLFWTSLIQFILMVCFFWVDFVPGYGYSSDVNVFFDHFGIMTQCFFGIGCNYMCALMGIIFSVGYLTTYVANIIMNEDSANFVSYSSVFTTPLTTTIFLIVGLNVENTPWWSAVPSVLLLSVGTFIWKYWEHQNDMKKKEIEKKPLLDKPINHENV